MKFFGGQDMVSPIKKILLKHPQHAFINQSNIEKESSSLNYAGVPDYETACSDYENFLQLIKTFDIEVHFLPMHKDTTLDSICRRGSAISLASAFLEVCRRIGRQESTLRDVNIQKFTKRPPPLRYIKCQQSVTRDFILHVLDMTVEGSNEIIPVAQALFEGPPRDDFAIHFTPITQNTDWHIGHTL
mgnify:CR=1 FL=1